MRSEWKPHELRFDNDARFHDYFLVRDDPERRRFSFHRAGFDRREATKAMENGRWSLYRFQRGL